MFIKAFLRHLHNFLPRQDSERGDTQTERKRERERGLNRALGDAKGWKDTLALHSRVHFMCTTYETLTPLRINYSSKRRSLQPSGRVIGPFAFQAGRINKKTFCLTSSLRNRSYCPLLPCALLPRPRRIETFLGWKSRVTRRQRDGERLRTLERSEVERCLFAIDYPEPPGGKNADGRGELSRRRREGTKFCKVRRIDPEARQPSSRHMYPRIKAAPRTNSQSNRSGRKIFSDSPLQYPMGWHSLLGLLLTQHMD